MNQPRPFLTALCFVLFATVFVSSNVFPESLHCVAIYGEEPAMLQRLVDDALRVLHEASRPRGDD